MGLICSLPGGPFELAVGIWLAVKVSSRRPTARISNDRAANSGSTPAHVKWREPVYLMNGGGQLQPEPLSSRSVE
jgi:hypothetical protein